jgi:hypothetical protein
MAKPTLYDELTDLCRLEIAAGFQSDSDIIEYAVLRFRDDAPEIEIRNSAKEALAVAVAEHSAAQDRYPAITDCDRLDSAFAALESQGILARQNFWCCVTCGCGAIGNELRERPHAIGYTFYHEQDTEAAVDGYGIALNYGAVETTDAAACAIGARVVEELQKAGLKPQWNGSIEKRIEVPLKWERRRRME